jgi:hypothetical protein
MDNEEEKQWGEKLFGFVEQELIHGVVALH